jgi:hypothetical protein
MLTEHEEGKKEPTFYNNCKFKIVHTVGKNELYCCTCVSASCKRICNEFYESVGKFLHVDAGSVQYVKT